MEYLYSALILHKTEQEITVDNVTKILEAAGVDVDKSRVKALVAALSDVDIDEALASASMMAAAPVAAAPAAADSGSAPAAAPEEEEEEEEEGEVIEDDDGLGSLFG